MLHYVASFKAGTSDALIHYGVKGMKWGVRRDERPLSVSDKALNMSQRSQVRIAVTISALASVGMASNAAATLFQLQSRFEHLRVVKELMKRAENSPLIDDAGREGLRQTRSHIVKGLVGSAIGATAISAAVGIATRRTAKAYFAPLHKVYGDEKGKINRDLKKLSQDIKDGKRPKLTKKAYEAEVASIVSRRMTKDVSNVLRPFHELARNQLGTELNTKNLDIKFEKLPNTELYSKMTIKTPNGLKLVKAIKNVEHADMDDDLAPDLELFFDYKFDSDGHVIEWSCPTIEIANDLFEGRFDVAEVIAKYDPESNLQHSVSLADSVKSADYIGAYTANKNDLLQFGVKGMKWGVRHDDPKSTVKNTKVSSKAEKKSQTTLIRVQGQPKTPQEAMNFHVAVRGKTMNGNKVAMLPDGIDSLHASGRVLQKALDKDLPVKASVVRDLDKFHERVQDLKKSGGPNDTIVLNTKGVNNVFLHGFISEARSNGRLKVVNDDAKMERKRADAEKHRVRKAATRNADGSRNWNASARKVYNLPMKGQTLKDLPRRDKILLGIRAALIPAAGASLLMSDDPVSNDYVGAYLDKRESVGGAMATRDLRMSDLMAPDDYAGVITLSDLDVSHYSVKGMKCGVHNDKLATYRVKIDVNHLTRNKQRPSMGTRIQRDLVTDSKDLMHYGVKGMRWGIRNDNDGSPRPTRARTREERKIAKADQVDALRATRASIASGQTTVVKNGKILSTKQALKTIDKKEERLTKRNPVLAQRDEARRLAEAQEKQKVLESTEHSIAKFNRLETKLKTEGPHSLQDDELKFVNSRNEALKKARDAYVQKDSWLKATVKNHAKAIMSEELLSVMKLGVKTSKAAGKAAAVGAKNKGVNALKAKRGKKLYGSTPSRTPKVSSGRRFNRSKYSSAGSSFGSTGTSSYTRGGSSPFGPSTTLVRSQNVYAPRTGTATNGAPIFNVTSLR